MAKAYSYSVRPMTDTERGIVTRAMPQDNLEVWEGINALLDNPERYMADLREASLEAARTTVSQEIAKRIAEQEASRRHLGGSVLRNLLARLK